MRILLVLVVLFSTFKIQSQTIFTDLFLGKFPAPLYVIEDYLYVGTFVAAPEPAEIYRVAVDNPTSLELVSDFSQPTAGIWKMTYDPAQNIIFAYDLIDLASVDLNQSLPVGEVEILNNLAFCGGGITQKDAVVYLACQNEISTIDTTVPNPMLNSFFTLSANDEVFNPIFFGDELYFSVRNNGDYNLYKLNINNPGGSFELVSTLDENTGGVQSSLVADSFLYLGIEGPTHRILKLDLSDTNYPLQEEVLIDNFSGAPIGLARSRNKIFITDGNTQNIFQFTDPTLGNMDNARPVLSIAPNPVADRLYISTNDKLDYSLYTISGQLIEKSNYSDSGIDVSRLCAGIYFVRLEVNGISHTLKFTKD